MTSAEVPAVAATRQLAVSAGTAWAALTDVRRHADWIPLTRIDVERAETSRAAASEAPEPPGPAERLAVGDRFTAVSGPGARRGLPGIVDRMVVERLDPPTDQAGTTAGAGSAVYRKTGPLLGGTAEVRVRPLGPQRCEVTWVERAHLRGPSRTDAWWPALSARLLHLPLRAMLHLALRRCARDLTGP